MDDDEERRDGMEWRIAVRDIEGPLDSVALTVEIGAAVAPISRHLERTLELMAGADALRITIRLEDDLSLMVSIEGEATDVREAQDRLRDNPAARQAQH